MDAEFIQLSLAPALIAVLAAVACALPGNFLLLRRQALIGDAISHVALPGIVGAYLVTGALQGFAMMIGAAVAAITAVVLIELVRRTARIEPGAAMGVVFTAMFAAGVLALEQSRSSNVHLDVEHALFGSLESLVWLEAAGWGSLLDPGALAALPPALPRLALVLALLLVLGLVFWRPLVASTFDETFAATMGLPVRLIGFGIVIAAAMAAVAAFEAVGPILAIAMFICPPATARLMTNRLPVQVALSALVAAISGVAGFWLADALPGLFGQPAVSAAGMIATVVGLALALACIIGPARSHFSQSGP